MTCEHCGKEAILFERYGQDLCSDCLEALEEEEGLLIRTYQEQERSAKAGGWEV